MKTDLNIDSDNLFQRRLAEKEEQRRALFSPEYVDSEETKVYIHQQTVLKPKHIIVGKPLFHPKF